MPFSDEAGAYDLWELRNRNPKFGRHNRPNLFYPVYVNPEKINNENLAEVSLSKSESHSVEVYPRNSEGTDSCWRWGKEKFKSQGIEVDQPVIWARQKKDGYWNIYEKSRKSTTKAKSIWTDNSVITEQGTVEAGRLDMSGMLEFPKPIELIKRCLRLGASDEDLVLDFFAGSGTLAHAVFELGRIEGVRPKYIAIQLPEPTQSDSRAKNEGYLTIADIAKERIRRASAKIRSELAGQLDLDGNQNLDLGFKVLKLDQSNFKHWQAPNKNINDEELLAQMALGLDHIDPNASDEDLLYELILKAGVMPTEKIELIQLVGQSVFNVAEGYLYVYLGKSIDQALIDAVLEKCPQKFICLDSSFHNNDQLKANAAKTFATFNTGKQGIDRIEFNTV
ncbi:MAG: hypothetical protein EOO07_08280 [Chitinophagaceae bacterium]|nr:MAG: hypothetical protein EOO07_08280 [Chitinophagaceae bacterium]